MSFNDVNRGSPRSHLQKKQTINLWKRHALCDSVLSMVNQIWSIWSYKSVTCKTEIDSLRSKLKSWLSRTHCLPLKERSFSPTGIDLVMKFQFSKGMDKEAWCFLLKENEIIYFYMFNFVIGYKGVKYKTEIHSFEHLNYLSKCWFALHISHSLILP